MNKPLATVICICYNHARFVTEALESVAKQTHQQVELIVIDDASTDNSVEMISQWIVKHPGTIFLTNETNLGYCKTFNKAYAQSKGSFLIDLAADDILLPSRIEKGINLLEEAGADYGVTFSDAEHVDEDGKLLWLHSDRFPNKTIPSGDVYTDVIQRYFICSPTMMFRRAVLESLNGYDESLAYEDFDLWVRASRHYKFIYTPEALVKKRSVSSSMSGKQFTRASDQRWSTYVVCKKIAALNRTAAEQAALRKRIWYEIRVSLKLLDVRMAIKFFSLL